MVHAATSWIVSLPSWIPLSSSISFTLIFWEFHCSFIIDCKTELVPKRYRVYNGDARMNSLPFWFLLFLGGVLAFIQRMSMRISAERFSWARKTNPECVWHCAGTGTPGRINRAKGESRLRGSSALSMLPHCTGSRRPWQRPCHSACPVTATHKLWD